MRITRWQRNHTMVFLACVMSVSIIAIVFIRLSMNQFNDTVADFEEEMFRRQLSQLAHIQQSRYRDVRDESPPVLRAIHVAALDRERMKTQGCVADGLLSGYGNEERNIALINRLGCYYLHRAVETWLRVPDWEMVELLMAKITRPNMVYGMFIAEAIDTTSRYKNTLTGKRFSFKRMCKPGTRNRWGKRTCVPDFDRSEYRAYVTQIMREAIDHGIQVFLIGQVAVQDARRVERSDIESVLTAVRKYADARGVEIMIGAQTNDITDKDYLRLFDFIEGGVGLHPDGSIEDGPCFSRYLAQNWCWALVWHERYARKAPAVFVHLDWSGIRDDDMATFVQMSPDKRSQTLRYLHSFFTERGVGFLLPVFAALPQEHPGCYGNKKRYYSADKRYGCADEDTIRSILLTNQ